MIFCSLCHSMKHLFVGQAKSRCQWVTTRNFRVVKYDNKTRWCTSFAWMHLVFVGEFAISDLLSSYVIGRYKSISRKTVSMALLFLIWTERDHSVRSGYCRCNMILVAKKLIFNRKIYPELRSAFSGQKWHLGFRTFFYLEWLDVVATRSLLISNHHHNT